MHFTPANIQKLNYVDFMAVLQETNRPPGGQNAIRILLQNTFLNSKSRVLDVGCNTGFSTFEIAHLIQCKVIGLDLNKKMIRAAKEKLKQNHPEIKKTVRFIIGDAQQLPFPDNTFDLVMSGGSTAFIENIPRALQEYVRVAKPWKFVGDVNFFFHETPPPRLLGRVNTLTGTVFQNWDKEFWIDQYRRAGLEIYSLAEAKMSPVSDQRIREYCRYLVDRQSWSDRTKESAFKRVFRTMRIFNQEHQYLSYGVFVLRKNPSQGQILFTNKGELG